MVEEVKTFGCLKGSEVKAELPAHLHRGALKIRGMTHYRELKRIPRVRYQARSSKKV